MLLIATAKCAPLHSDFFEKQAAIKAGAQTLGSIGQSLPQSWP
jgi:hypothetical protein